MITIQQLKKSYLVVVRWTESPAPLEGDSVVIDVFKPEFRISHVYRNNKDIKDNQDIFDYLKDNFTVVHEVTQVIEYYRHTTFVYAKNK